VSSSLSQVTSCDAALVGALAALTASAWATNEAMSDSTYAPANDPDAIVLAERTRVAQTGITIEERRLSEDERIQVAVIDKLAANPRLSGKIGVESNEAVVTLTGYTATVGQATRAGWDARSVMGVKYVQNQIRPRVGGSV
jgi:hypothetical protein